MEVTGLIEALERNSLFPNKLEKLVHAVIKTSAKSA